MVTRRSTQRLSIKKAQQASNRLRQPPDILKNALSEQKLLPAEVVMPVLNDSAQCLWDWWEFGTFNIIERLRSVPARQKPKTFRLAPAEALRAKQEIELVFASLPDGFRQHLKGYEEGESDVINLALTAFAYENFRTMRSELREIVRVCQRRKAPRPVAARVWFGVDAQGHVTAALPRLYKALDGIEAFRIRECQNPKCKQIFWAGRIDMLGCGDGCAQAIRDKRYYETKGKLKQQERRLSAEEKLSKVREAIRQGHKTGPEISKSTGISMDDTDDALAELMSNGEIKLRARQVYLTDKSRKGR